MFSLGYARLEVFTAELSECWNYFARLISDCFNFLHSWPKMQYRETDDRQKSFGTFLQYVSISHYLKWNFGSGKHSRSEPSERSHSWAFLRCFKIRGLLGGGFQRKKFFLNGIFFMEGQTFLWVVSNQRNLSHKLFFNYIHFFSCYKTNPYHISVWFKKQFETS